MAFYQSAAHKTTSSNTMCRVAGNLSDSLFSDIIIPGYWCAGLRLWHLPDVRFAQPRSYVYCRLSSPAAAPSARDVALQNLWVRMTEEALNEEAYLAGRGGVGEGYGCGKRLGVVVGVGSGKVEGFWGGLGFGEGGRVCRRVRV